MTVGRKKVKKAKPEAPKYEELSLFFQTFVGEYVQVTTDIMVKSQLESEEGVIIQETPLVFQGFLLDEDSKYYYLGEGPGEIANAVKIDSVKGISIVPQVVVKTEFDNILDDMPDPESEEEFN
jgi:hypothetical protein